jgi:hypothetical protein
MKDWQAAVRTWAKSATTELPIAVRTWAKSSSAWWKSEQDTERMARQLGMSAKAGESWDQFRSRISDRLKEQNRG